VGASEGRRVAARATAAAAAVASGGNETQLRSLARADALTPVAGGYALLLFCGGWRMSVMTCPDVAVDILSTTRVRSI